MNPIDFPATPSTSNANLSVDEATFMACKQAIRNIGAGSSERPSDKLTKALTKYKSITVEKYSVAEVASKDDIYRQSSVRNAMSQEMASESRIPESVSAELDVIGFDLESVEVVENLVAEIRAKQSLDVPFPDGWQMKEIDDTVDKFIGMIHDANGMPRISCFKKTSFYDHCIRLRILSYDYALIRKYEMEADELNERFQKYAADELKRLMGERVFEDFRRSDSVVRTPGMFCNHQSKLARHVNPVLEWGNNGNNKKHVEKFLVGMFKNSETAIQLHKFVEMFVINKDLQLVAQLCSENTSLSLPADAVYDAWKSSKQKPHQFSKTAGSTTRKMTLSILNQVTQSRK